jgi:hypothetical protein
MQLFPKVYGPSRWYDNLGKAATVPKLFHGSPLERRPNPLVNGRVVERRHLRTRQPGFWPEQGRPSCDKKRSAFRPAAIALILLSAGSAASAQSGGTDAAGNAGTRTGNGAMNSSSSGSSIPGTPGNANNGTISQMGNASRTNCSGSGTGMGNPNSATNASGAAAGLGC